MQPASFQLRRIDAARFDPDGAGCPEGGIFGLPFARSECSVALLGVPWEPTTSYGRGTARGPEAILNASPQLDLYDAELAEAGLARPWLFGIGWASAPVHIVELNAKACALAAPIVAAGGVDPGSPQARAVNELGARLNAWVEAEIGALADAGQLPGLVGGDHSVSLGAIRAMCHRHPGLGILHLDAHADLRVDYEGFRYSHASVMHRVLEELPELGSIVQVGIRDLSASEAERIAGDRRVETFFDYQLRGALARGEPWDGVLQRIVDALPERVYVSFDIDGLNPQLCPGTGTPVPGGLEYGQAMSLLRAVAVSGRTIVGFDLVEVAPSLAHGEWDGNVGARMLYRLCGAALRSNGAHDDLRTMRL